MFVIRAMERMGLKGTLACAAVLFAGNAYVFTRVSHEVATREQRKSDELIRSLGKTEERPPTVFWHDLHKEELKRIRAERASA